jgi:hypothetical protein
MQTPTTAATIAADLMLLLSRCDPVLFQQRTNIRLAASEVDKRIQRIAASTTRQNRVEETMRRA